MRQRTDDDDDDDDDEYVLDNQTCVKSCYLCFKMFCLI